MAKITLSDVSNILGNPTSAANTINANNDLIEQALEKLVSRDGESPNQMTADIDLNHNDIINVDNIHADVLVLDGKTVTPDELATIPPTVMMKSVYDPQGKNADAFDSNNTDYRFSFQDGVVERSVSDRLRDAPSVKDFGAAGDGVTPDNAAVTAMMNALGYVRFTRGSYALNTINLNVPIFFGLGASLNSLSGQTVSISSRIESPRQYIFQGAGSYALGHIDGTGEDAREVHISWFGAFPQALSTGGVDQSAFIQKATDSMGNGRESVIHFDVGNYWMRTGVTLTRGCHIKGDGTRRTVFKTDIDGFTFFTSGNVAGKLSDIQFEIVLSAISTRVSPFIEVAHDDWEIYNVNVGQTELGVVVSGGNNARIRNLKSVYGANQAVGSSIVRITGGGLHSVKGIYLSSSGSFGPSYVVDISSAGSLSNIEIEDIQTLNPAVPVRVRATGGNMSGVNIRNIIYNGFAGDIPATVVHVIAENGFGISGVNINGVNVNSRPSSAVRIENTSTSVVENITIDGVIISGSTGNGIEFIRGSTGALRDVLIGGAVEVAERSTPYFYSGNPTGIKISPTSIKDALPVVAYDFTVADDSFVSINLQRSVFSGWLMVAVGNTERAIYTFRAASSPTVTAFGTPSANMNAVNTSLNGTTGVDTKFTTGVTDGVLYFENRLGASTRINVTLMAANI